MKLSLLSLLVAIVAPSIDALAPPTNTNTGRRAFLNKGVIATATIVAAPPAFAADQYSLELDESYKKPEPEKKSGSGGTIVGGALAGGLLLSLPFFAPNLARLAGIKNAKIPK